MMLYPSMNDLLKKTQSRYLLVNIIARRAREISEEAEQTKIHLEEKPVSMAVSEIANGYLYGCVATPNVENSSADVTQEHVG